MANYALIVHYGDGSDPARVELPDCSPDDAEVARQSLLAEVEHALSIEAPLIYSGATDEDPQAGVPIDPTLVTSVDLVDAEPR